MNTSLEFVADARVVVDDAADIVDQADDGLGRHIARCRLAREDGDARHPVRLRIGDDVLVTRDHVQHVEQLPLVFVDALDLHVEQTVRADLDAGAMFDVRSEAGLVGAFDGHELVAENSVVELRFNLLELAQMRAPVRPDGLVEQDGQAGIGLRKPAARRHPICHIREAVRPQRSEVGEDGLHQQVRV